MTRHFLVLVHRYLGLFTSTFLILVGLSGSLLAFNSELEHVFAPRLFALPHPGKAKLDLATLAEMAESLVPGAAVAGVSVTEEDQVSVQFRRAGPPSSEPLNLGFNQFYIDPWTGEELGRRTRGDLGEGLVNVMPFIYLFHFNLMAGETGLWILGIVAIAWTLDAFVAFYLTLPATFPRNWYRWKHAWKVKWPSRAFRLNFDFHRAGGLWLWPIFFILAWSSVMFNMRTTYEWVTASLFEYKSPRLIKDVLPQHLVLQPKLGWREAQEHGKQLMADAAAGNHFAVIEPLALHYHTLSGTYRYEVRSSRDVFERSPKGGSSFVVFDGDTGQQRYLHLPTGSRSGNTIESWLYALHMARVFGRPYQIFVSLAGIVLIVVSATGIYIWWRKRKARLYARNSASHDDSATKAA